ncbi:MAG: hypothetical protein AAGE93_19055 [Bacteroidota bacterium]
MRKVVVILPFILFIQCSDDDSLMTLNRDYFLGSWQIDTDIPALNQLTFKFRVDSRYTATFDSGGTIEGA